jgi:hypothetical protein
MNNDLQRHAWQHRTDLEVLDWKIVGEQQDYQLSTVALEPQIAPAVVRALKIGLAVVLALGTAWMVAPAIGWWLTH